MGIGRKNKRDVDLNPNNDAFWQSRGYDRRPPDWEEWVAVERARGIPLRSASISLGLYPIRRHQGVSSPNQLEQAQLRRLPHPLHRGCPSYTPCNSCYLSKVQENIGSAGCAVLGSGDLYDRVRHASIIVASAS